MSTHKTDWHLGLVAEDDGDPFAHAGPIEQIGLPICLDGDEAVLHERLTELLESEEALKARDVRCGLRERPDSNCSACPIAQDDYPDGPLYVLCRVAKAQERTIMEIAALNTAAVSV